MEIKTGNYETLTQVAKEVDDSFDYLGDLIDEMWRLMVESKGCGLAANQVGILLRVIVISTPGFTGEMINPVISEVKFPKQSKEGCLSFPGEQKKIKRFNKVTVQYFDRNGNYFVKNLKALSSFCAQHEIDHLNGITIINKPKT